MSDRNRHSLGKLLIRDHEFDGAKLARVWDLPDGCGGSGFPSDKMKNDMICQILEGEFRAKMDDKEFTAKAGDVFVCAIGETEEDTDTGQVDAVMRVIDLMAS